MRKFEVCKGYNPDEIILPTRSTKLSAGYDFYAAEEIKIPSFFKSAITSWQYKNNAMNSINVPKFANILKKVSGMIAPTIISTGVKACMNDDEYLEIVNRSSSALKKNLLLANGVGIIDADYYNNPDNDGEIKILIWNLSPFAYKIKKGDKIAQGVFHKFLKVDNDNVETERQSGLGSTN